MQSLIIRLYLVYVTLQTCSCFLNATYLFPSKSISNTSLVPLQCVIANNATIAYIGGADSSKKPTLHKYNLS